MKNGLYFSDGNFFIRVDHSARDGEWLVDFQMATKVVAYKGGVFQWEKEKDFYSRQRLLELHVELVQ